MIKILFIPALLFIIPGYSYSQNVGIGTSIPVEKLHVAGNIKADTIKPNAIKLIPNSGAGKMLTSDAAGNASWQESSMDKSAGFGSWGDCSMNGISEYNPVADAIGNVDDEFGCSVSISGNYAIVGAYGDDVGANSFQGSASIYQYNGSSWLLMQKLIHPSSSANDFFGHSVSISGNYAIVGSYSDDVGASTEQGSATIFIKLGAGWQKLQFITDPGGTQSDFFGVATAIDGNTQRFLIGANSYGSLSGKAVFGKVN